jgi:hypothetical protein
LLSVYPLPHSHIVARQQHSKNIPTAIEELLDALFSVWYVSFQRDVGDKFFRELLVHSLHMMCEMNVYREDCSQVLS